MSVVGNRPQFIKSGPVSVALRRDGIDEAVLHTGQHWDKELSDVFFEELGLPEPAYRLGLKTADPEAMRPAIYAAVQEARPDWVLVYGDTNSTLAGTEAAVAAGVPVAHVEAGLRSGDLTMPEERNRIAVDRIAALLFAPDERSAATLRDEGVPGRVEVVGDVMADASRRFAALAAGRQSLLADLGLRAGEYGFVTIHREANTQQPRLGRIVAGLNALDLPLLFPLHPRTRAALAANGLALAPHVQTTKPLSYLDLTVALAHARVAITDSGGLQKEAYWHGVPCVTT